MDDHFYRRVHWHRRPFSLFTFHFSLFTFHFSLFAFQFSLVACRSGAATNSYRQGTGIGCLLLNVLVAAALQLKRITLAPSLACSLADDVIFNIMTSQSLFIALPACLVTSFSPARLPSDGFPSDGRLAPTSPCCVSCRFAAASQVVPRSTAVAKRARKSNAYFTFKLSANITYLPTYNLTTFTSCAHILCTYING
jgi:hypothetical protein